MCPSQVSGHHSHTEHNNQNQESCQEGQSPACPQTDAVLGVTAWTQQGGTKDKLLLCPDVPQELHTGLE